MDSPRGLSTEDVVNAINEVLAATRPDFSSVTASTPLSAIDLASIDFVEVFVTIEDTTGYVFDLRAVPPLDTVGDLVKIPHRRL